MGKKNKPTKKTTTRRKPTRPRMPPEPREVVFHSCGAVPTRVQVALQVVHFGLLRPHHSVDQPQAPPQSDKERAALGAGFEVLTRYLAGDHEFEAPSWVLRMRDLARAGILPGMPRGPQSHGHGHGPPSLPEPPCGDHGCGPLVPCQE